MKTEDAGRKPVEREQAEREQGSVHFASLPLISALNKHHMAKAKDILEELDALYYARDENGKLRLDPKGNPLTANKRIDQLKVELQEIQEAFDLPGMRYGDLVFAARESEGRKTLSREKLVELGVKASVVEQATVTGEAYWTNTFKRLGK